MTAVPAGTGRILIVDDDAALLRSLARSVKRLGHVVDCAQDGATAVSIIENGKFDVVLTDVGMPGMNGLEFLLAVRRIDLDVPVVLMTGAPGVATATCAVEYGALRYLAKPIDPDSLGRVLEKAVRLCRMARVKRQALLLVGNVQQFVGDRAGLEARFGNALDTLWMAYQPIVSMAARSVYAYEALVRNAEPTLASPLALFAAAHQLRRLHDLGRAIRKSVAGTASAAGCKLFVNLNSDDFTDEELYSDAAPLSRFASRVVLEITERESLDHVRGVQTGIKKLRAMGYQIAVDDLGAGYAGLTSLAHLHPEIIKIDMSLVRGVNEEPVKRILVVMMLGVAHEMGMTVVAEGVETAAERGALRDAGCDLLQGHLFARPGAPFPTVDWTESSSPSAGPRRGDSRTGSASTSCCAI